MSVLFLSHSSSDKALAESLREQLLAAGFSSVFIDNHDIHPGQFWEQTLYERLRAARAVIALITSHFAESKWCFAEITHAKSLGRAILPVVYGNCSLPKILETYQSQRLDVPDAINRLLAGLALAGITPHDDLQWDGLRPPYPGLSSFEISDGGVYFGREDETHCALDAIHDIAIFRGSRALLILGGSGTGKSSFLRAGLVPRMLKDREQWTIIGPFRPRNKPFTELQRILGDSNRCLDLKPNTQIIARTNAEPGAALILVIDQLEDLASANVVECNQFVEWLSSALISNRRLIILATLRSDYLSELERLLPQVTESARHFPLGKISDEGLHRAIERPAEIAGTSIEDGLAIEMLDDVRDREALPLLAFTLRSLWDRRVPGESLSRSTYRNELGGVTGALRRATRDALLGLNPDEISSVRHALLRMVHIAEDGRLTRQRVVKSDLPESAYRGIESLVSVRLLVADGPHIEPAHESLYQIWPQLRDWLDAARSALIARGEIETAAEQWQRHNLSNDYLWSKGRLERATSILQAAQLGCNSSGEAFIKESSALIKEEEKEEQQRRSREIYRLRQQRLIISAFLILTSVAALITLISFYRARRSAVAAKAAQDRTTVQLAAEELDRDPTGSVRLLLDLSPDSESWPLARLTAISALNRGVAKEIRFNGVTPTALAVSPAGDKLAIGRSDGAIEIRSMAQPEHVLRQQVESKSITDVWFTPDSQGIVSAGADGVVDFWNLQTSHSQEVWRCSQRNPHDSSDTEYFLLRADKANSFVFASTEPCGLTLLDLTGNHPTARQVGPLNLSAWGGIAVSPSGKYLAVRLANSAQIYETTHGNLLRELSFDPHVLQKGLAPSLTSSLTASLESLRSVAFTFDDRYVVASSFNGDRLLWEIGATSFRQFAATSNCVSNNEIVTAPSSYLVVQDANDGRAICTWQANDPEFPKSWKFDRYERDTGTTYVGRRNISLDASGRKVASPSTTEDNSIRFWNLATEEAIVLQGHRDTVPQVVFSPDGSLLVSRSYDVVRIWHLEPIGRQEIDAPFALSKIGNGVGTRNPVAMSRDAEKIAYASGGDPWDRSGLEDDSVQVWAPQEKKITVLKGWRGWSGSSSFDPSGRYLAVSSTAVIRSGDRMSAQDSNISIANLETRESRVIGIHNAPFADVSWSSDGRWLVSSGGPHIVLWDVQAGSHRELASESWKCQDARAAFASRTLTLMTTCGQHIRMIDIPSLTVQDHIVNEPFGEFAVASDGRSFAISVGERVEVWNATGIAKRQWAGDGHESEVKAMAFSADDSELISSSSDSVRLWETQSGFGVRFDAPAAFSPTVLGFRANGDLSGVGETNYYIWSDQLPRDRLSLAKSLRELVRPDLSQ